MIATRNRRILDALYQSEGLRVRAMERVAGANESQLIVHGVLARAMNSNESSAEQMSLYDSLADAIDTHELLVRT